MITLESPTSLNPAIRTGSLRKKLQVICDHVYQFFTMLPCHFLAFQFLKLTLISSFRHLFCCKHIERLLAEVWLTNKATKFLPGTVKGARSQPGVTDMDPAIQKKFGSEFRVTLFRISTNKSLSDYSIIFSYLKLLVVKRSSRE